MMDKRDSNKFLCLGAIFLPLTLLLTACSFHTAISYRVDKNEEYAKSDGFMIDCEKDGDLLIVSTFTPDSWGKDFYYGYLRGPKTDKKIKIISVDIRFPETGDNLTLDTIREQKIYCYTSEKLNKIINRNKTIIVSVGSTNLETGKTDMKDFVMSRRKRTYPTGTFPHR